MRSSRRTDRSKSPDTEVIFLKPPPKAGEFLDDSEDEDLEGTTEFIANCIRRIAVNAPISQVEENNSGNALAQKVALYSPILYPTRGLIKENDSIPNLDVLIAADSSVCLPKPYSEQDSDSIPDLTILKAQDQPPNRLARPFSAKPRVIRKHRLKTDQHSHTQKGSEQEQQGTSQSPEISDVELVDFDSSLEEEENKVITFGEIKWILPEHENKRVRPELLHDYPYTKLQPIPQVGLPIGLIPEEDEDECEDGASAAKQIDTPKAYNKSPSDQTKNPMKRGPGTQEK